MLTEKEVDHIAKLARIELSDAMRERMRKDLSSVLDFVAQLEAVDTAGVEPLYQVTGLQNQARPDAVREDFPRDEHTMELLVDQAPQHEGRLIKVKAIKGT